MRRGIAISLLMLLVDAASQASAQDVDGPRRLYDRQADCAVFENAGFAAERASWQGPCVHGLANGQGTASFFAGDGRSEQVSAMYIDGVIADGRATIAWSDGARYSGETAAARPEGAGVLVDAKGDRFDGQWRDGALNGRGTVYWANGDRYDGDWANGKAEGHGVQTWADGRKYDGAWHNDQPDGDGTLTARDGATVSATFVDGKRQPSAVPAPTGPAPDPSPADGVLDSYAGKTLIGVDGSTIAFVKSDLGLVRAMTSPGGSMLRTVFDFAGKGLGTVSDADKSPQADGVFHQTPSGVVVEYADGRTETLTPAGDGLSMTLRQPSGEQSCAAWYPQGHVFSAEERKEAVASYARRLGVADATSPVPSCAVPADSQPTAPVHKRTTRGPARAALTPAAPAPARLQALTVLSIRESTVHLIDAAPNEGSAGADSRDESTASNCLKVDSDGHYWGFSNHCGYAVQFAYCVLHGRDGMTACGSDRVVSIAGSVSANGFSALFADDSLAERDVDHEFRWVGCKGGAGEVSAHLDTAEPVVGRCVRSTSALAHDG